jgi:predicted XRE-type DNA-binding protein
MRTISLYFPEIPDIKEFQRMYSTTYRKVYNNIEKFSDKEYIKKLFSEEPLLKLNTLNTIEKEVKSDLKKYETQQTQIIERIDVYNEEISELLNKDKSKTNARLIKKLEKKVDKNLKQIGKKPVFGSKLLAREMTYNKNMFNKTGDRKYDISFNSKKEQWKENRLRNFYSIGNSSDKGNRYFEFDFINDEIIFKPNRNTKIIINISPTKSQKKELLQLHSLIDLKEIPVTVYLSSRKISIIYSSERLNNFDFKDNDYKKEIRNIKSKEERSKLWVVYKKDQEQRKLKNKQSDVYCGIDLNPEYIGIAIRNKTKILFFKCYDLKSILKKTKDNNTETIRYNLAHIYKDIFSICSHYKVSHFTTEELSFKHDEPQPKSFNRKTKNLWCREFQKELIEKYTEKLGIIHIEVNPAYSSFVGNMMYECFDPVAASLEICRRGMVKYKICLIESWYPDIKGFRLSSFGMHVSDLEIRNLTVPAWYQLFKSRNQSYRRSQSPVERDSKSKLILTRTFQNTCKILL